MYNLKYVAIIAESYSGKVTFTATTTTNQVERKKWKTRSWMYVVYSPNHFYTCMNLIITLSFSKCVVKLNLGSDFITIHNDPNIKSLNSINTLDCVHSTLRNPNWIWFVLSMKCISTQMVRICCFWCCRPTSRVCVFVGEWKFSF